MSKKALLVCSLTGLSDAKLVLTDELIAEMLRQRKAAGILNENALN